MWYCWRISSVTFLYLYEKEPSAVCGRLLLKHMRLFRQIGINVNTQSIILRAIYRCSFHDQFPKPIFFRWCQYGIAAQNLLRDWDNLLRHLILTAAISFLLQQSGFRALQILDFGR